MIHHLEMNVAQILNLFTAKSVSNRGVKLQYHFITYLGGGDPSEIPVYRVLFLYYHIPPCKFLLPIPYFFQYLMNYHITYCNG